MTHANERLLARCEGVEYLRRYSILIAILRDRPSVCLEIFPTGSTIRVCSPGGQLLVVNGMAISFFGPGSIPKPDDEVAYLDVIEARIERAIVRTGMPVEEAPSKGVNWRSVSTRARHQLRREEKAGDERVKLARLRTLWDLGAEWVSFSTIASFAEKQGWRAAGGDFEFLAILLKSWVDQGIFVQKGGEGKSVWAYKLGKEK